VRLRSVALNVQSARRCDCEPGDELRRHAGRVYGAGGLGVGRAARFVRVFRQQMRIPSVAIAVRGSRNAYAFTTAPSLTGFSDRVAVVIMPRRQRVRPARPGWTADGTPPAVQPAAGRFIGLQAGCNPRGRA